MKTTYPHNPKEATILYKTIVLRLLEERPEMYRQLQQSRTLLATLNRYSQELSISHNAWKERLLDVNPGSSESQIESEAAELALKELVDRLPSPLQDEDETFSLESAMAFIRKHTPAE